LSARRLADRFADDLVDFLDDFRAALALVARLAPFFLGRALTCARFALFFPATGFARRAGERFAAAFRLRAATGLRTGIGSGSDGVSMPRAREITFEMVDVIPLVTESRLPAALPSAPPTVSAAISNRLGGISSSSSEGYLVI
jgi:hypothetical protein